MNFILMRKLTYQEQRWAQSLSLFSSQTSPTVAKWLEGNFLTEEAGRALIIQAQEHYAVLFLTTEQYNSEHQKNEEISNFFSLLSFLRYLHYEGYLTITRGKESRETSMFFLQDAFVNPQPIKGKIILNGKGEYTEKPDKIHDANQRTVYQGTLYDQDQFDLILSTCTGSLTVSSSIEDLFEETEPEADSSSPEDQNRWSKTNFVVASAGLFVLILLGLLVFFELRHHNKLLARSESHLAKTDSLSNFVRTHLSLQSAGHSNREKFYGVDVSKWNGNLVNDIDQADDLTFVICKATQGTRYVDPRFHSNWKLVAEKGLIRGAYHFYDAGEDAIDQAEHFAKVIGKLDGKTIAPILDIEPESLPKGAKMDHMDLQVDLLLFLKHIERLTKRKPIVYTDPSFGNQYLKNKKFAEYPLWIADYTQRDNPTIPQTWKGKGYKFWQKSDAHDVASRKVDFDVFLGELSEIWR